jgi:DNA-binding transcriptional regulator YiaG
MLAHTRRHPIKEPRSHYGVFCLSTEGQILQLPLYVTKSLAKYTVKDPEVIEEIKKQIQKTFKVIPEEFFDSINKKFTKAGALLKAVRLRENLSQLQFAAALEIKQGDLSKMENGKRPIGKAIARRIAKKFGVNAHWFLQV